MAKLKYLVIHSTATPEGREVTKADIVQWHIKERGWSKLGYSDLIQLDGNLVQLHKFDQDNTIDNWEVTNGAKGYNGISRHVVYAGGTSKYKSRWTGKRTDKDTRTKEQRATLETYVKYQILRHPNIKVIGHNQISRKACPSFDVSRWLESIGVKSKNIGL